jgi:hypothetical protein
MRHVISFILIVLTTDFATAQVNTERYFTDYDNPGFTFQNGFGFNFATGNTKYLEFSDNFRGDYNGQKNDYLLVAEYAFKTSSGTKATNKGFLHLRRTQTIGNQHFLMSEVFTQLQFDEFLLLKNRFLFGGGLRFDPVMLLDSTMRKNKILKVFIGTGLFYEFERYSTDPEQTFHLIRSSSYLTLVWAVNSNTNINLVNYYQPSLDNFHNFRYIMNLGLSTLITHKLYYDLSLSILTRSKPIGGKKPDDIEVKNTLRFKF